ncbi:hypothetical protein Tco_0821394 [Tanacetum coccineum]|uniref:Uncharacterized protein n=1 Tax=Tanacetum coccineum TaxID=301880 RepID=A0ABQ5AC50_9ASTR
MEITATIDGRLKTVTEASIRRHFKLEDSAGINSLPNAEIFEQLALMGYGEGSTIPVDSQNTPTVAPSTSQPTSTTPITTPETSPSKITSSPSLSSPTQQSPPSMHTTHDAKEPILMPHESPLYSVYSLRRDEGSLSLSELTVLCTNLSNKVTSLEVELAQTKQTYGTALTKFIKKVKKLEQTVKSTQAKRRFKIVVSDDEEGLEDPSKQGRKITEINQEPSISLVQDEETSWIQEDIEIQEKISDDTEVVLEKEEPSELVEDQGSGEKGEKEVSTIGAEHSTVIPKVSTAAANLKQEVVTEADPTHVIDWSDPAVLRYHAQLNRPYSVAEVRKNMVMYGIKFNPFVPMDSEDKEKGSKKKARGSRKKTLTRKRAGEKQSDQSIKRQKMKDDAEKEDFKEYLNIVPEEGMNVEALQTKYPLIDWEIYTEDSIVYWKIIRVGDHTEIYQFFEDMLKNFDKDGLVKLWKLVKDRFS